MRVGLLVLGKGGAEGVEDHGAELGGLEHGDARAIAEELGEEVVG